LGAVVLPKESGGFRAAYVVGKKFGIAVARNRIKRILREAFRAVAARGEGAADIVFLPRAGEATLEERKAEIEKIFKDAGFIPK
jgi:ribonuclease P protein component